MLEDSLLGKNFVNAFYFPNKNIFYDGKENVDPQWPEWQPLHEHGFW